MSKLIAAILSTTALITLLAHAQDSQSNYYLYVAAESEDEVAVIQFDGQNASILQRIPVGVWPSEIEGPHGVTVSPDRRYWFVSMAHGQPYGSVYKYETATNKLVGSVELGLFPATMQISTATGFLYAVNFNLHGDMVPSSVSIVEPDLMVELARVETGVMPHGSRISPDGMRHYSVGMMDGKLYEMNTATFKIERTLSLDEAIGTGDHGNHVDDGESQAEMTRPNDMRHSTLKPTWAIPHPSGNSVFVALNGHDQVVEIDLEMWQVSRTFTTGAGPYNLDISSDGKTLVATYKKDGTTGIWDLTTGSEVAVVKNSRDVTHGVTISPDNRFAFVSVEGIGAEPGSVDIIDLSSHERVAVVETGKQAGGIYFWKIDSSL